MAMGRVARDRAPVRRHDDAAGRAASARWRALPREALLITGAVLVYFGVRGVTVGDKAAAFAHSQDVAGLEQWLGIDVEHSVQQPFLDSSLATDVMNWVYIWGHWPVIVTVLTWLFLRHPDTYRLTRGAMLISGGVGLLIVSFYPVAPPRLADPALLDTVTEYSRAYRVLQPPALTNPYAAVPSLHVGWDLLIGLALVTAGGSLLVRVIGVALPVTMAIAVVATANHYLLDGVAGIALVLASLAVMTRIARRGAAGGAAGDADLPEQRGRAEPRGSADRPATNSATSEDTRTGTLSRCPPR